MKPILFNTEMVKAILDGRKTTTRRVIKPQPVKFVEVSNGLLAGCRCDNLYPDYGGRLIKCPYEKGDILYVRETWRVEQVYGENGTFGFDCSYKADNKIISCITDDFDRYSEWGKFFDKEGWQPSLFMPKEAARIFLRVTDVKAERLQDITEDGAKAEGIRSYSKDGQLYKFAVSTDYWEKYHSQHKKDFHGNWWQDMPKSPTIAFSYLWDSTIKKSDLDHYGWNANPWVWVISFERCEKEGAVS